MSLIEYFKNKVILAALKYNTNIAILSLNFSMSFEYLKDRGDFSTNIAIVLAKFFKAPCSNIAKEMQNILQEDMEIDEVKIAGPGFINFKIKKENWINLLLEITGLQLGYGDVFVAQDEEKVNLEFTSANPTGPIHIGHVRGAILGDVYANILKKAGYKVTREYYINDHGNQILSFASSVLSKYKMKYGVNSDIKEQYSGEYMEQVLEIISNKYKDSLLRMTDQVAIGVIKDYVVYYVVDMIRKDLEKIGVFHDVFCSEEYDIIQKNKLNQAFNVLKSIGLIYEGILEKPKGKIIEDWEPRKQEMFRSSLYGDDVDRPIKKSDGTYTYFATDVAYHLDKIERGYQRIVLILGADHAGYTKRLEAAVQALSGVQEIDFNIILSQLVVLTKEGKPMKMSKRAGVVINLNDILKFLDKDAIRFAMIWKRADTTLQIDVETLQEQSKNNPIFYVQYAHTRINSILEKADKAKIPAVSQFNDCAELLTEHDVRLIKKMAEYPDLILTIVKNGEVHRLPNYLYELASEFHSLWGKGIEDERLRFIVEDDIRLSSSRCMMVKALAVVLRSGLKLIGITPAYSM